MKNVTLFTTSTWPHCYTAKEFLSSNNIPFKEKDINNDFLARTYLQSKGVRGVPAILVGDELVQGFDQNRLKQLLSI